jgi:hypothetical protein
VFVLDGPFIWEVTNGYYYLWTHQAEHVDDMLNWFKQRGFKNRHHHRNLFHKQERAYAEAKQKATDDAQNDARDEQAEVIQEAQYVDEVSAIGASTGRYKGTVLSPSDGPLSPEPDAMSPEDPAALARMGWQSPSDDNGLGGLAWEEYEEADEKKGRRKGKRAWDERWQRNVCNFETGAPEAQKMPEPSRPAPFKAPAAFQFPAPKPKQPADGGDVDYTQEGTDLDWDQTEAMDRTENAHEEPSATATHTLTQTLLPDSTQRRDAFAPQEAEADPDTTAAVNAEAADDWSDAG